MSNEEHLNESVSVEQPKEQDYSRYRAVLSSNCFNFNVTGKEQSTYYFALPSVPLNTLNETLTKQRNNELDLKDASNKEWKTTVEESIEQYTSGSLFQSKFENESNLFEQGLRFEEELKTISDFKFKRTEGELKGEVALLKVSKLLGLGDIVNIPLPHSGIWVTIKPPTEKDLIDFYNVLFREKTILGRATSGLTLSNFSVYVNSKLTDFILKHVHNINYKDMDKNELSNYILIHDLPILAWGFAASIYPNGFNFSRACIEDVSVCNYVAKGLVDLKKLLWIDNLAFSEGQKNIFNENRPAKHTLDLYRKYIADHSRVKTSSFSTNNGIKFHLKIPTLNEYFTGGMSWVNKVNDSIESVILGDVNKEEEVKKELLTQYIKSSALRQYSHFVDYIEVEDNVINDRETLDSILDTLSADDDIRKLFIDKVNEYISNTTIALVGIPEYKCPSCKKEQIETPVNEKFVNVIPLDTINLFFGLITLRIAKITEREI